MLMNVFYLRQNQCVKPFKSQFKTLMKEANPKDFNNAFLVMTCEFGAVLGEVLARQLPGLHWLIDWPYWESSIFDPQTGQVVAVFHWAIKKFSSYGIDDGFKAKTLACVDVIRKERAGNA